MNTSWCDVNKDVAEDVEIRFYASNYEVDRPLPKGKIKKLIWLMKDESGGKLMTKFAGLIGKNYSYLKNDDSEDKEAKDTKKVRHKRKKNYQDCFEAAHFENKIKYLEKWKTDIGSIKIMIKIL